MDFYFPRYGSRFSNGRFKGNINPDRFVVLKFEVFIYRIVYMYKSALRVRDLIWYFNPFLLFELVVSMSYINSLELLIYLSNTNFA